MNNSGAEIAASVSKVPLAAPNQAPQPARQINKKLRWAMTLVWASFIFYLSTSGFGPSFTKWLLIQILSLLHVTVSAEQFEFLHFCVRKLAHLTEYCIFSLMIYASFLDADDFEWRPRLALRSVVIAGLYSLTDEYHQSYAASRTPSLVDSGIDTAGAAFATLMVFVWDRLSRRLKRGRAKP